MEILREGLVSSTRLLGAEHEKTLKIAQSLAVPLYRHGQHTECEQLLRETMALSRRALDPAHDQTQCVLRDLRALDPTARRATWMSCRWIFAIGNEITRYYPPT